MSNPPIIGQDDVPIDLRGGAWLACLFFRHVDRPETLYVGAFDRRGPVSQYHAECKMITRAYAQLLLDAHPDRYPDGVERIHFGVPLPGLPAQAQPKVVQCHVRLFPPPMIEAVVLTINAVYQTMGVDRVVVLNDIEASRRAKRAAAAQAAGKEPDPEDKKPVVRVQAPTTADIGNA